jgi:hypothetical protein
MEIVKRGRGRPKGSKDGKPRQYRNSTPDFRDGLSVEDKIRQLKRPVRVSVIAEISGLSEATLRKKIDQDKIRAFKRSGVTLIEPLDFLEYWLQGRIQN